MSTVALLVHRERPHATVLARELAAWLRERGHEVRLPADDAELAGLIDLTVADDAVAEGLDLAVSIGGDGTMLRTVDLVATASVPVLGINVGQLGYLTEVEPGDSVGAFERFFAGEHIIEERMLVHVEVESAERLAPLPSVALNEAVLEKTPMGHTVRLGISFDGEFFTTYAADGLIIASPTGSTAYSFSARGPIVDPSHRALVVTPVSPHMLFDRSMVLAPDTRVTVEVLGHRPATLSVDGRNVGLLHEGDTVTATSAEVSARLVRFGPGNFHRILKTKFGLSDR